MRFLTSAFLLFITSSVAIEAEEVKNKNLQFRSNEYLDKLSNCEIELQNLLNRVETLEHRLGILSQRFDNMQGKPADLPSKTTNLDIESQRLATDAGREMDVFDLQERVGNDVDAEKVKPTTTENPLPVVKNERKLETEKELYDVALASLKDNDLQGSEQKFSDFIQKYPKSPMLSQAYFWYGEVFFRQSVFDKASINYLKAYRQSPKGLKAADALLKLSLSLGSLGKKQDACSILVKLNAEFPSRAASSIKGANDAKIKYGCKDKIK